MKNTLYFFVTAPAWLLVAIFIFPILLSILVSHFLSSMFISKTLSLCSLWSILLWLYSIGVLTCEKYDNYLKVPLVRFKACIFYNLLYTFIFIFNITPIEHIYAFHIISIVCNFYTLYFVSKLIVMVERKNVVKVRDYIGTFIAAWFYLIGIWWIQPRVTRIFLSDDSGNF